MTPHYLSTASLRLSYTFNIELDYPMVDALLSVARLLAEQKIQIETLLLAPGEKKQMWMVLGCLLEKERVNNTMDLLSRLTCIKKIELKI